MTFDMTIIIVGQQVMHVSFLHSTLTIIIIVYFFFLSFAFVINEIWVIFFCLFYRLSEQSKMLFTIFKNFSFQKLKK